MLINAKTEVAGDRVVLVPYDLHLVPAYHEWMTSTELLDATASNPLSLEEEYEMQKSWRLDNDKLTFIVLDRIERRLHGDVKAMIGDTNLFILEPGVAEVMIMIAVPNYRRKGYGREAINLMFRYGIETLGIESFIAKIGRDNKASIKMFNSLQFEIVAESDVFDEVTLKKLVTPEWRQQLVSQSYDVINLA